VHLPVISPHDVTGMVLAGGRGTRMGGVDKGLQNHHGMPLALHALQRLQAQVGAVMVNANRNLATYELMGVPVLPDASADFPGPLGGLLAGLQHCKTPWLVTVPCDSPNFPLNLVQRLAQAAAEAGASGAFATTLEDGMSRAQPVFCLVQTGLLQALTNYLQSGERKMLPWLQQQAAVQVLFGDASAFFNANTVNDLLQLQRTGGR